jgi:hypothetical protein
MTNPRYRVLAVEPDPTCAEGLKRLISDRANAEVVIASSAEEAVNALAAQIPDLLLISALLSATGEEQIMWQLKRLDVAAKVPVLTIPPAVEFDEPGDHSGGPFGFLFRKRQTPAPIVARYDRGFLGDRIIEALKQSRAAQPDRQLRLAKGKADEVASLVDRPTLWEASAPWRTGSHAKVAQLVRPRARGRRAHRLTPDELPWSSNLIMPNGVEVRLVNVSRSGILVESPIKFVPDSTTEFHLKGGESSLIVPARFIRSEVSAVDALGVRYQAAAVFSTKVELFPASQHPATVGAAPQALAELLVRVTAELNEGASPDLIRKTFEQGLRRLVPACDIKLRQTPAGSIDGGDSIYFTVPTPSGQSTVLQATFDPEYEPALEEFKLLRAAASVAAVVVQYQGDQRLVARG